MHSLVICLSAVLLSKNRVDFNSKTHKWNTFFFLFFIFSRNDTGTNFHASPHIAAAGAAGGERVYGFRLCLDERTDGQTFYTLPFGGGGKAPQIKISSHDDVYIFAKLYKVALIVKSPGKPR